MHLTDGRKEGNKQLHKGKRRDIKQREDREVMEGDNRHQRSLVVSWGFSQQENNRRVICLLLTHRLHLFAPFYLFLALPVESDCSTMSHLVLKGFSVICHPTQLLNVKQDTEKQDSKGPDRRPQANRHWRGQNRNSKPKMFVRKAFDNSLGESWNEN